MIKFLISLVLLLTGLTIIYWISFMHTPNTDLITDANEVEVLPIPDDAEIATLAGGCFWCIEAAYEGGREGVYEAISGFSGGTEAADYKQVTQGNTGHKEAVQVLYDPKVLSYEDLLTIFWQQIDPTDDEGQFADRGDHYRTAIFYHNDEQKQLAESSKQALIDSEKFEDPIVTEILPFTGFFPAEENHQDFAQKRSGYYRAYKYGSGRGGFIDRVWGKE